VNGSIQIPVLSGAYMCESLMRIISDLGEVK